MLSSFTKQYFQVTDVIPLAVGEDRRDFLGRSWNECIFMNDGYFFFQTMSQSNFLLSLQSFAKDTINDEMVELLAPYLEMEDYNMETAKRVSSGCVLGS